MAPAALLLLTLPVAGSAATWTESGEATDLPPGQETVGTGSLDLILGSLETAGTDVDLFAIFIRDPDTFSVLLQAPSPADPKVYLFDRDGLGIVSQDDVGGDPYLLDAHLPMGNILYAGLDPGVYLLAVAASNFDRRAPKAMSSLGPIFPLIFNFTNLVAAAPPGGNQPLSNWAPTDETAFLNSYDYTVTLTGSSFARGFAPEPSTTLQAGAALLSVLSLARWAGRRPSR
jgi:hypothetical protein